MQVAVLIGLSTRVSILGEKQFSAVWEIQKISFVHPVGGSLNKKTTIY